MAKTRLVEKNFWRDYGFSQYQYFPILSLTTGVFTSVFLCLFSAYQISEAISYYLLFSCLWGFFFRRFFILGLLLGLMAVSFNAKPPYNGAFKACHFRVSIYRANYSSAYRAKRLLLSAEDITCPNAQLPPQKLLFWDYHQQFKEDLKSYQLSADLVPITFRLNPYEFDNEKYWLSQSIRLSVKNIGNIEPLPPKQDLTYLRNLFTKKLFSRLSKENANLLVALLTGNRSGLSYRQKRAMQATGTTHLLAVSGLHVGLIGGVFWLFFQMLWALSSRLSDVILPRTIGAVAAFFAISLYAYFTGFDIPVRRAWLMFSLLIISWLFLKEFNYHSLLLAANIVVFFNPYAVVSLGFYLSFLATFIVIFTLSLSYSALAKILLMQIMIYLSFLPIIWWAFGIIPLSAFVVNLLLIPWLSFWLLPSAITAVIADIINPHLGSVFWLFAEWTMDCLWRIIYFFQSLQWTILPDNHPLFIIVIAVLCLTLLAMLLKKPLFLLGFALLWLPIHKNSHPQMVIADSRYSSVLMHNGSQALLINPGRKAHTLNQAKKWWHYLNQRGLQLEGIILSGKQLSKISATHWLLEKFPRAKVITLKRFRLPYASAYCQSLALKNLALVTHRQKHQQCQAKIDWFGTEIALFPLASEAAVNAVYPKSIWRWHNQYYDSQKTGAITISQKKGKAHWHYLREDTRLWRHL